MTDKTFTVCRPLTGTLRIIRGKSLKDALKKYGLNPDIWKEPKPAVWPEEEDPGEDKGAPGPEDN